ncbi:hypothetical protein ACFL9T_12475 [Thermodesulfobacteriota bacterium]
MKEKTSQNQVLDVSPTDDLPHTPTDSATWRESLYFEFFDNQTGVWSYQYIGERPNKNHSGLAISLWSNEGYISGRLEFAPTDRDSESHRAAGLQITTIEPMEQHKITYEGPLIGPQVLTDKNIRLNPKAMRPGAAKKMPSMNVRFDLNWEATMPVHTFPRNLLSEFFSGHIQQVGRCHGTIETPDKTFKIDGPSFRDRSWGERNWFGLDRYVFIFPPFENFCVATTRTERDNLPETTGWMNHNGNILVTPSMIDEIVYQDVPGERRMPRKATFTVTNEEGIDYVIDCEILAAVPSVFQDRDNNISKLSWIDRCPAHFSWEGQTTLGIVENLELIDRPDGWS